MKRLSMPVRGPLLGLLPLLWLVHPASLDLVFSTEPDQLWKKILREGDFRSRLLAEAPDDPAWN